MAFGRKQEEEIKTAETTIWECNSDSCNAWVRDNFKMKKNRLVLFVGA
ncbi:cold-inducible protein YdjO-related protein [Bacillus coahuilensis]